MNNIDYFNQELEEVFKESMVNHKDIYELNRLSLEKMNDSEYLRKFEDDFQISTNYLSGRLKMYLTFLEKRLEDKSFKNQREFCSFCSNVIHREVSPKLTYEVELEGKNLYVIAVNYRNEIREKEGRD